MILKTVSVNTKCHVTLYTSVDHCSPHAPRWTHVTSGFLVIAARPVLIVMCVQSFDVFRSWGWSPYRHGWLRLMPSPCQPLSNKRVKNLCVRFSSHHMKIKGCNCWQCLGPTGGKRAFLSTSCSVAGCVGIGHPICIINMPHVTVIIRHNCRLYCIPVFIAVIAFCGCIVNVCQQAHISLVPPHHSYQVTPGPYSNVATVHAGDKFVELLLC